MEVTPTRTRFYGDGATYFGIVIVNALLTAITFGLYYPWAKAKELTYLYGETEFAGTRLQFHGTGKEMFKGFIKALVIIGIVTGVYVAATLSGNIKILLLGVTFYLLALAVVVPIAIHGSLRYRMSRTSWRGIHFGYRGSLSELIKICIKGFLLSMVTLGIYTSWFTVNLREYTIGNIRLGNCKLSYRGNGTELFLIHLKSYLLTLLTLGIYSFWYARNLNHYFINNLHIEQDGEEFTFRSNITAGDIFINIAVNLLLIIFTLGLAAPFVILREMRLLFNNIELEGAFNPDNVLQTEESYTNATGEDMLDMLDLGFDF